MPYIETEKVDEKTRENAGLTLPACGLMLTEVLM